MFVLLISIFLSEFDGFALLFHLLLVFFFVSTNALLLWTCVCVLSLGPDSIDESVEEPFSLPTPPVSGYK